MTYNEKRDRKKFDLKVKILEEAKNLATEKGWNAVSMRKIAERIDYSVPMIYTHFRNKDELLLEITREGFQLLTYRFQEIEVQSSTPNKRVVNLVMAYWDFAFSNEMYYQVMHSFGAIKFGSQETPQEAIAAFKAMSSAVESCGSLNLPVEDVVDILWSTVHGMISLTMYNRIKKGKERADQLLIQFVNSYLDSLMQ